MPRLDRSALVRTQPFYFFSFSWVGMGLAGWLAKSLTARPRAARRRRHVVKVCNEESVVEALLAREHHTRPSGVVGGGQHGRRVGPESDMVVVVLDCYQPMRYRGRLVQVARERSPVLCQLTSL